LPTRGITGAAFIVGGVLAAGAGLLDLGAIGSAYPTIGPDFLLPAFAVAFLGRTMVRPGEFNVGGMALASLILAVGVTGLTEMGIASWVTPVFDGGVLIITVTIAILRGGRDAPFHLG
jgi:ribose transport system permease protein